MKNFYLIANGEKPRVKTCLPAICSYLEDKSASVTVAVNASGRADYHYTDTDSIPEETECVLVLGGDGTICQAVHDLKGLSIPVIGINFGHLGYLCEVGEDMLYPTLDRLLADDFFIEERMTLDGEIIRDGEVICVDTALNDVVVSRLDSMKMLQFSLSVDGQFLTEYYADGMIIASPTGSTAYSLSAGGPFVMPTSNLFVLTPLAPHTIKTGRSIILPENVVIELKMEKRPGSINVRPAASFDSDNIVTLKEDDVLRIRRSKKTVRLIRLNRTGFLETLGRKLR